MEVDELGSTTHEAGRAALTTRQGSSYGLQYRLLLK